MTVIKVAEIMMSCAKNYGTVRLIKGAKAICKSLERVITASFLGNAE